MNSIFNSDTNEGAAISLNSSNIIIVSEDGTRWSPEFESGNKNVVPLRVVNNVLNTMIETNSNEEGNEEMPLNAKNVMIVSEDSSEWSQDFIAVNNQAPLAAVNDANHTLNEGTKKTQKSGKWNVNYTVSANTKELSNSVPDSEDLQHKNSKEPTDEFMNPDLLRCRTCLSIVKTEEGVPLYTPEPSGETLKELLIYLLPQMVSTLCDEDVVCKQCNTSIKFCVDFIDNCLKVETELLNEFEEDQEEFGDTEMKYKPEESTHVTLDHDYMVSQGEVQQLKTETDTFMEKEESGTAENFLSNDDPTLASTDEYLFECFTCSQTFESENAMDNHAKVEHGISKPKKKPSVNQEEKIYYKCTSCEVLFATKSAYNLHVQNSHPEKGVQPQGTYSCKQCNNKFFYLGDLFEHKRRAHGFNCTVCPERFNLKEDLEAHLETHPDLYSCEVCGEAFKTKKAMTSHVRTHENSDPNTCAECDRNFDTPEELAAHIERDEHPMLTIVKNFVCEICDTTFSDKKRLNRHKQVFHNCIRQYLCTICDKNFSSKTSLDSHYRLKHAEVKPYQCERCGERFARLDYLRRHNSCSDSNQCKKFMKGPRRKFRYTKADGEPIKCKLCGKVFKDVYLLKLHLTTHTNLRRFRCSVCNLTFTTNKNRERHEKIHDDPLSKYRCTVCWKRTQSQEELDSHMMSHEKKYQCHVCRESFARVYLLNYHVSEVHADDEDVEKEKQIVFTEGLKEYLVEY